MKRSKKTKLSGSFGCLVAIVCILVIPFTLYKYASYQSEAWSHQFKLSHFPAYLKITKITYEKSKHWGIGGPGDNETGVLVYELPPQISKSIRTGGLAFLQRTEFEHQHATKSLAKPFVWYSTPINTDEHWIDKPVNEIQIADFLTRWGYGIDIDSSVQASLNQVLGSKGNFYTPAWGGGIAIIAPSMEKAFFVYAG